MLLTLLVLLTTLDGPQDNLAEKVRPVPAPGVAIPDDKREKLTQDVETFGKQIEQLRQTLRSKPLLLELLPDVQIYHKAVLWALKFNEFYDAREVATAEALLQQGVERATQLASGKPQWLSETGLVVRGYRSKIDGSVQPYGLVVPASFDPKTARKYRLDIWCHGRDEKLTELRFINARQTQLGEFAPKDVFVLHPYGRYCNANKFAGEVDLFEAMEHAAKYYPIDEDNKVMRGFSMGGAAAWHFTVHHPDQWRASAPGAGFSETPEFLNVFQNEAVNNIPWYEKKLWHMYNATDYALNLHNVPTIAYSGEIDKQKQAADVMAREMAKVGLRLRHIIGPKTGHSYHPAAKVEIERRLAELTKENSAYSYPMLMGDQDQAIKFKTYTLRYAKYKWLTIQGLEKHWEPAEVKVIQGFGGGLAAELGVAVEAGELQPGMSPTISITTKNINALSIDIPASQMIWLGGGVIAMNENEVEKEEASRSIMIDKQMVETRGPASDRFWQAHFVKKDGKWKYTDKLEDGKLHKRPGLQGPIDDAFMDSFLVVKPSGKSGSDKVDSWVETELKHFQEHWRSQFRGELRIKSDKEITPVDEASHNLILWGTPESNSYWKKLAAELPVKYEGNSFSIGEQKYDATKQVPVLIYPNPKNSSKYIVLNSGFTFREYDYLNNARQVSKLPDWAVLDLDTPPSSRYPGNVLDANFFDEEWKVVGLPK